MEEEKENRFVNCIQNGKLTEECKRLLSEISASEAKYLKEKYDAQFDKDSTLDGVSQQFDVTRKRIKEIEEKALKKLRNNKPEGDGPDVA
jgi:DNA-directed RNA polymerase sigma subunit (sigma70/sigma32)